MVLPFANEAAQALYVTQFCRLFSLLFVVDERWRGGKWLGSGLAEGSCNKIVISLGFVDCASSIPRSGLKFL